MCIIFIIIIIIRLMAHHHNKIELQCAYKLGQNLQ